MLSRRDFTALNIGINAPEDAQKRKKQSIIRVRFRVMMYNKLIYRDSLINTWEGVSVMTDS